VLVFGLVDVRVVSAKVPDDVYKELLLRVPEGDRSDFIREAIVEKLLELVERMGKLEGELVGVRKVLADLELLTFGQGKVNPHAFCIDEVDHKIVDYLTHYKGATTPELADYLKVNRWLVLNRLRKMQKTSKKQFGKAVIDFYGGVKSGKKKAWWINEEMIQGE
jgi:hypothetical protein